MIEETDASTYLTPIETKKILKVLSDLGCRTSLGESYEDIIKSDNSQEKEEPYILHLLNWGNSKLETVKVIKQQLCLDLKQAKDLVDNCPIDIDLHEHAIAQDKYKDVLTSLVEIGVHAYLTTKEQ